MDIQQTTPPINQPVGQPPSQTPPVAEPVGQGDNKSTIIFLFITLLIVVVIAGFGYWFFVWRPSTQKTPEPPVVEQPADQPVQPTAEVSVDDKSATIDKELNDTLVDDLDAEFSDIDKDLLKL